MHWQRGLGKVLTDYVQFQGSEEPFSGCLVCCDICQHAEGPLQGVLWDPSGGECQILPVRLV